ncbi:MAG: hypothetical protein BHV77_07085 [Bacteroides sp. 43_108]|nr:MAG: hypothetical protein BHV77_07085 [Bacteroides sp. 43_108]
MKVIDIKELINDRTKLNADTLVELKAVVEEYPFFQTARLLYVANLYAVHDRSFGEELRKASVFLPDRRALFYMIEGEHYVIETPENAVPAASEKGKDRTISLIDNFLSNQREENENKRAKPTLADLTTDYAAFLVNQDDVVSDADEAPKLRGQSLIDNFIEVTKGKQRIEMPDLNDEDYNFSPAISPEDEEIYTEKMTDIYIKQGRYAEALGILKKICLNNPKKSAYFANQMKLLEVILGGNA